MEKQTIEITLEVAQCIDEEARKMVELCFPKATWENGRFLDDLHRYWHGAYKRYFRRFVGQGPEAILNELRDINEAIQWTKDYLSEEE